MEELFPRYALMRPRSNQDPSSYTEMQLLRDSLEKERTRRKHLERHIQNLQNRILELQQQLAIAVSADKKKDVMIEQLDKTLAKVVEGWNKHETERSSALGRLQEERDEAERARCQQQEKLGNLEQRLSQTVEILNREQLEAADRQKQIEMLEKEKRILVRSLDSEKQHGLILQSQQEEAVAGQIQEQKRLEALRATLEEEQEAWALKERQLEERYERLQEDCERRLESEKARSQKDARQALEAKQVLASVQAQVQQLESELDATRQERDRLEVDITLGKARHESQKMKLESELEVAVEQQVIQRLAEVHEENSRQMGLLREQHRKQLLELCSHQEKELSNQLSQFKAELLERDEKMRRITDDYEIRLAKFQEEMRELTGAKRKLESQRSEMVGRLQCMMQMHCNEALRLLMNEYSPHFMKARQVEKDLSDSSMSPHDLKNPSTQKTMAVPPSKVEPPPPELIQRKLFETEPTKAPQRKAVLEMHAGEGVPRPSSQTDAPTQEKPKAAVKSFHGRHSEMSQVSSHNTGSNDNLLHSKGYHTVLPQAVPLQPAIQWTSERASTKEPEGPLTLSGPGVSNIDGNTSIFSSHQHHVSENHGNFHANRSQFYPLIANEHRTTDLSQLLHHSFASQMSFSPLEPQVDETGQSTARHLYTSRPDLPQELPELEPYSPGFIRQLKAVLGYPHDELSEQPFTNSTENTVLEATTSEGSFSQNTTMEDQSRFFLPPGDLQRQSLQHCIRLLLDRTPGDPLNEKQENPPHSMSEISLPHGDPFGYRDRSTGIWDHLRHPPARQEAALRMPQAVQKTKMAEVVPDGHRHEPSSPPQAAPDPRVRPLSPETIAEIVRLLEVYKAHPGQPLGDELLGFLQIQDQGGLYGNLLARRNLEPKLNEAGKKEAVPGQMLAPRRPSSTRTSIEKPPSAKVVKKPAPPPSQGSVKSNRSGVWR